MNPLHSPAAWFVAGLLLLAAELAIPGVLICFFGAAAMLMAGLLLLWRDIPSGLLVVLYLAVSLALLFGLRRLMPKNFGGRATTATADPDDDDVVGASATVIEAISPDAPGKVEFRGTNWTAVSHAAIPVGARVTVLSRNDLTLSVKSVD